MFQLNKQKQKTAVSKAVGVKKQNNKDKEMVKVEKDSFFCPYLQLSLERPLDDKPEIMPVSPSISLTSLSF